MQKRAELDSAGRLTTQVRSVALGKDLNGNTGRNLSPRSAWLAKISSGLEFSTWLVET